MTSQKHYSHTMNVKVSDLKNQKPQKDIEVTSVVFLTPAKITVLEDGKTRTMLVGVDIVNRTAYEGDQKLTWSNLIFDYLSGAHSVPEDFYAAPETVTEKFVDIDAQREKINEEMIGVEHE